MKYDLTTAQPLIEAYPDLAEHAEFRGDDLKLRFVIAFLDDEIKEPDISKRIEECAKIVGLEDYDDDLLTDHEVEQMIYKYFFINNNETYKKWLSRKMKKVKTDTSNDPVFYAELYAEESPDTVI